MEEIFQSFGLLFGIQNPNAEDFEGIEWSPNIEGTFLNGERTIPAWGFGYFYKRLACVYLMCSLCGCSGFQRCYLGQPCIGCIFFCTCGICCLGNFAELFLIPLEVSKYNEEIRSKVAFKRQQREAIIAMMNTPVTIQVDTANEGEGAVTGGESGYKNPGDYKPPGTVITNTAIPESFGSEDEREAFERDSGFICPITRDLMLEPVIASDGQHYERMALLEWLKNHTESPITRQKINTQIIVLDVQLKSRIDDYRALHPREAK